MVISLDPPFMYQSGPASRTRRGPIFPRPSAIYVGNRRSDSKPASPKCSSTSKIGAKPRSGPRNPSNRRQNPGLRPLPDKVPAFIIVAHFSYVLRS